WVAELAETSLAARARYMTDLERMAVRDHRASSNAPVAMPVPPTLLSEAERRRDRANDGPSTRPVNPPGLAEAAQRDAAAKEAANVEKAKEEVAPREGDAPVNPVSSSVDGESAWLALRRSSKRRLALAGGGLFVAGLATVVGIVRARASGPRVTAIEEPVILVSPALTTSTPIDSPVEEAPATPEVAVPAEGEHSEQHAAKTSAPSAAPRRATTVSVIEGGRGPRIVRPPLAKVISSADAARAVAAPTTPTPKSGDTRRNCHPPYVVDAAGIKRFKVECL
ncbi:MAG TPA: hypothetical protein VGL13_14085, partial [Polyangiaceae bacterium]